MRLIFVLCPSLMLLAGCKSTELHLHVFDHLSETACQISKIENHLLSTHHWEDGTTPDSDSFRSCRKTFPFIKTHNNALEQSQATKIDSEELFLSFLWTPKARFVSSLNQNGQIMLFFTREYRFVPKWDYSKPRFVVPLDKDDCCFSP
ncbi:hypothetical protein CEXT_176711 [Caerostris extrusa]|uniref:Lipoprotein n=1 Tax=Caerostris extrusa TaxID=172846 RepID=A0AAV4Y4T0_CAEEX|nr:hypothetical protein CEXT_176711 [Caerostris extrusa]